jgi:hypothetical protein
MRCRICGDRAKYRNYGVISCMSCKVFFQRHGLKNIYASVRKQLFVSPFNHIKSFRQH